MEEFFKNKKEKAFYKFLRRWLAGRQYTDSQVALHLSSFVTHIMIEVDHGKLNLYAESSVESQLRKLSEYVGGLVTTEEMLAFHKRLLSRFECFQDVIK